MAKTHDYVQVMLVKIGRVILYALVIIVLLAAAGNALFVLQAPDEHQFDPHISNVVRQYPIDPLLVRAVIWRESNFDPTIYGRAQERGLMQVTPVAGKEWADKTKVRNFHEDDLYDPYTNIKAGTWYLTRAMRRYADRDEPLVFALAEYNAGRSNVLRWIDPDQPRSRDAFLTRMDYPTTKKYILTIEERYARYKKDEERPRWQQWLLRFFRR